MTLAAAAAMNTRDMSGNDDDDACMERLQSIESLLLQDCADAALTQAQQLFAEGGIPPARVADLCRLTALAAQQLQLTELAETMWQQAAAHAPNAMQAAEAHTHLGVLLSATQRPDAAEACWRRAIDLDPGDAAALANLAVRLGETGRAAEAETCYRRVLALSPDHAAAHTNLGLLLQNRQQLDEAEAHLRRALALAPTSAAVLSNLGNLLAQRDAPIEAEACLRRALALDPHWAAAHNSLGVLLDTLQQDAAAEAHFRRALELRPGYPLARLSLAYLLLAQGRFDEGWPLYEARHDPALPDNGIAPPDVPFPRWHGESLAGRALLIWPEQGLGDQIQFCRYVPRLKALGAARITLVCQRQLQALFETLPGVDRVVAADVVDNVFQVDAAALTGHDVWSFPISIATLLRTDLSTLPQAPLPYLHAAPPRIETWTRRCADHADGMLRVGLVWRGNPRHHNDAERSLPGLATLAKLWSVRGVRFFSLQAGSAGMAALTPPAGQPLQHLGSEFGDFAGTAAALAAMDLLICVDTSIAHLAGALAMPCWVLLPQHRTDWRWLRERDDSPWYPSGMRLFRQAQRGDWAALIERVRDALAAWAERHP